MKLFVKFIFSIALIAFSAVVNAQETLYIYKNGVVIKEYTLAEIDSITFYKSEVAGMSQQSFTSTSSGTIGYWLYTPQNATTNMPLIVYLHGGSGRGSDLSLVIGGSLPQFLYNGTVSNVPAYVIMPQCPSNKAWEQIGAAVIELVNSVVTSKGINSSKISLTGHSMGGSGTWSLGATYASIWSCIAPLSGSVNTSNASQYVINPVWAFVGSADVIVDPVSSQTIVPLINSLGGNAQIKTYDGATHFDVPDLVYKDQSVNLLNWMVTQTK